MGPQVPLVSLILPAAPQTNYFPDGPAAPSPAEVGKRVDEHFVTSPHAGPRHIVYQEVCTWYGALTFAQLSGDKGLSAKLIQRFDPLMTPAEAHLIGKDRHVDFTVFGTVPLEIYQHTERPKVPRSGQVVRRPAVGKSDSRLAAP